ncbi:hypothetical protein PpBr36_02675 [Pyricularia pennisetigena]|uniref:hypothetical protein n=1 Tax=Pyricularia pennisetigena TaxID=1578925 RepID=UPI001152836E|nr:hypothetical protein PpBr36_02675 [Pyricularia pennisetigena]TLS30008.1 hypothetical protein PpBr36_02675 [Pyricularia pennisetigena]
MASAGDIITGLEVLIKLFHKVQSAPEKLEKAAKETKRIKRLVGRLKKRMSSPSFDASEDAAQDIREEVDELEEQIEAADALLHEYQRIPRWEYISRLAWICWRLPRLDGIAEGFDRSRRRIAESRLLYPSDGTNIERTTTPHSTPPLPVTPSINRSRHQSTRVNCGILNWATRNSEIILAAAQARDDRSKQTLLDSISQAGIDDEAADGRVNDFLRAVQKQEQFRWTASVQSEIPQVQQAARSVAAQYFLEVFRKLIMNSQKRWLFAHVESASCSQPSSITDPSSPSPSSAMAAAAREGSDAAVPGARHELVDSIHRRISNRTTRHVSEADFGRFDHIICFEKLDKLVLTDRMMQHSEKLGTKARTSDIHYLTGCEKYSDTRSTIQAPWERLSYEVGFALTEWIFLVLGLKRPCTTPNIKWQTVEMEATMTERQNTRWERSWKVQGCEAHSVALGDKRLLFVSGPPDKVTLASVKIRLCFPS